MVNVVAWAVCLGVLVCSIFVHHGRPGMGAEELSISGGVSSGQTYASPTRHDKNLPPLS